MSYSYRIRHAHRQTDTTTYDDYDAAIAAVRSVYGKDCAIGHDGDISDWHDGTRYRLVVGSAGKDGIQPGVAYRVEDGELVRA